MKLNNNNPVGDSEKENFTEELDSTLNHLKKI